MRFLKIIDFDRKGNVVRFYLGEDDCQDYWGDDWDDAPYDCNAGTVYDRFISGHKDMAFPFDSHVLEPCDDYYSRETWATKDDMKKRKTPCIIVVPEEAARDHWGVSFNMFVGADGVQKFYFGDHMEPDENT